MNKSRLEAFTDAVLAIIMTIMVLEIKVPDGALWHDARAALPYIFAYIISFLGIANLWYHHHFLFGVAKKIDRHVFLLNNLLMLIVSFFPWVTAWVGRYPLQRDPEYAYTILQLLWAFAIFALHHALLFANHEHKEAYIRLTNYTPLNRNAARIYILLYVLLLLIIWFWPLAGLVGMIVQIVLSATLVSRGSDQIF